MWSPVVQLKSWLKDSPAVYDRMKPAKRMLSRSAAYDYLNALSRSRDGQISFIQIGANDGLRNDPIREFVVRDRWRGVLVEPLPDMFAKLKRNYGGRRFSGLHFENAAVSQRDDEVLEFWTFRSDFLDALSNERRLYYLRKSSFDRNHVLSFLENDAEAERALERIIVPCVTVSRLATRYFDAGEFDLLVIDAEGHEKVILDSIDFARVRPRVIFFESEHLSGADDETGSRLRGAGYRVRKISVQDSVAELGAGG